MKPPHSESFDEYLLHFILMTVEPKQTAKLYNIMDFKIYILFILSISILFISIIYLYFIDLLAGI